MLIDNLEILEEIGSGLYGQVFRAYSPDLGQYVAVKCGYITQENYDNMIKAAEKGLAVKPLEYGELPATLEQYGYCTDCGMYWNYMIMELATPIMFDYFSNRAQKLNRIARKLAVRIEQRCGFEVWDYAPRNLVLRDKYHIVACDL